MLRSRFRRRQTDHGRTTEEMELAKVTIIPTYPHLTCWLTLAAASLVPVTALRSDTRCCHDLVAQRAPSCGTDCGHIEEHSAAAVLTI